MVANVSEMPSDSSFLDSIHSKIVFDSFAQDHILDHIIPDRASSSQSKFSRMDYARFSWQDGLLFRKNRIYISNGPSRLEV
jgi:hypothetical protein